MQQLCLIASGNRDDVVHREVTEHTRFNLYLLGVGFPLHLIARLQFLLGHHAKALEHLDTAVVQVTLKDFRTRLLDVETTSCSLFHPLVRIAVTVEADGFARLDVVAQDFDDGMESSRVSGTFKFLLQFRNTFIHTLLEVYQCFCDSTVECNHGRCTVSLRTNGTELEAVACEGEW